MHGIRAAHSVVLAERWSVSVSSGVGVLCATVTPPHELGLLFTPQLAPRPEGYAKCHQLAAAGSGPSGGARESHAKDEEQDAGGTERGRLGAVLRHLHVPAAAGRGRAPMRHLQARLVGRVLRV